jgi:hypothetical protein
MLLASARRAVFIFPLRSIVADVSRSQCRFVMNRANRRVSNCPKSASECQYCARQNGEFHGFPPAAKHIAAASGTELYVVQDDTGRAVVQPYEETSVVPD